MTDNTPEPVALFRMTVLGIPDPHGGEAALVVALGLPADPPPPWVTAADACQVLQAALAEGTIQENLEDAWRTMRAQAN